MLLFSSMFFVPSFPLLSCTSGVWFKIVWIKHNQLHPVRQSNVLLFFNFSEKMFFWAADGNGNQKNQCRDVCSRHMGPVSWVLPDSILGRLHHRDRSPRVFVEGGTGGKRGKGWRWRRLFKHWWDIGKKGIPKPSWSYTMDHHGPTIYQLYSLYLIYILLILFRFIQSTCCGVAISLRSCQMSENGMRTNVWDCMLRAQAVSFYAAMQCHSCPTPVAGRNHETQDRKIKSSKLQNGDMPTWMLPRT